MEENTECACIDVYFIYKINIYMRPGTAICSVRHLLGFLEHSPHRERMTTFSQKNSKQHKIIQNKRRLWLLNLK